jgi:two-component system, chemotaxis family, protein-glutamate methylesterase/glutaminase
MLGPQCSGERSDLDGQPSRALVHTCRPSGGSVINGFPVVALVCSLGGADALIRVLRPLGADLPAAVVALQHLDPSQASTLPSRLAAATRLSVRVAADGAYLQPGVVDVAPPGRHLLLAQDCRLLLVNSQDRPTPRPSADLLLVSMAAVLGERLLAVVLTGRGDDGAIGVQVVHRYGGRTLVQDETSSQAYAMPAAALAADSPDPPIALDALAGSITEIVNWMVAAGPDEKVTGHF